MARTVQNHVGLTFNALDLDPDSKQVVMAVSETALLNAAQSVRLHPDSRWVKRSTGEKKNPKPLMFKRETEEG